jgi:hypothetical protein
LTEALSVGSAAPGWLFCGDRSKPGE